MTRPSRGWKWNQKAKETETVGSGDRAAQENRVFDGRKVIQ